MNRLLGHTSEAELATWSYPRRLLWLTPASWMEGLPLECSRAVSSVKPETL